MPLFPTRLVDKYLPRSWSGRVHWITAKCEPKTSTGTIHRRTSWCNATEYRRLWAPIRWPTSANPHPPPHASHWHWRTKSLTFSTTLTLMRWATRRAPLARPVWDQCKFVGHHEITWNRCTKTPSPHCFTARTMSLFSPRTIWNQCRATCPCTKTPRASSSNGRPINL